MKIATHILCRVVGHNWRFKDCSYAMKSNGEKYEYSRQRKCLRCMKREYFYDEWIEAEKDGAFVKEKNS